MKFNCKKEILLNEILNASDFTAQRNTITMLACVLLEVKDNTLTVKANDQKTGFISYVAIESIEDGKVAVLCDKFLEILKNLPDEEILIEEAENILLISTTEHKIEFKLKTIDPSGFPEIVIPQDIEFFKIPQKDLTEMIKQVSFAVSDDEKKYAMNGALLEKEDNSLNMVATDGRRLSFINKKIDNPLPSFEKITIPSRFLEIIKKHSSDEGIFEVGITNQAVYIKTLDCLFYSGLIKNEFPPYRRVIPENHVASCVLDINNLENALKRASLLVENKFKKIIVEFIDNKAIITTEESEIGTAKEEIPCIYEGEPFKFSFNYTYLQSPLKVMDGKQVRISFTDNTKPFTVTSEPERDYKHIIMVMNLKE